MIAPTLYAYEGVPSILERDQIAAVLETARADKTPAGLRDYAILQFLATYGLRSGEICNLRIEDIDWRTEAIHVRHHKTRASTSLPLMEPVGEALLAYLRSGRPVTDARKSSSARARPIASSTSFTAWFAGCSVTLVSNRLVSVAPISSAMRALLRCCGSRYLKRSSATCWGTVRQDRRLPISSSPPRTSGPLRLRCREWRCWHDRPLARSRPRDH